MGEHITTGDFSIRQSCSIQPGEGCLAKIATGGPTSGRTRGDWNILVCKNRWLALSCVDARPTVDMLMYIMCIPREYMCVCVCGLPLRRIYNVCARRVSR